MRRIVSILMLAALLCGCGVQHKELERAMALRAKVLTAAGCSFDTEITANYADRVYTFLMHCVCDGKGKLDFTVLEPESISGITGSVSDDGGKLTFDDQALAFELLADGQVSPVSAGWLLMKALRGGYIRSCGVKGDKLSLQIDDSYADDALHLEILLGENDLPEFAEILYKDRRFLSFHIRNFQIL